MRCANWLVVTACAAALTISGCSAPPKRGKSTPASKPVATKTQSKTKTTTAKSAAKTPTKQAKAAPPKAARTPQERYAEALEFLKASQWQEAEKALADYVKQYPQYSGPHTNLGIVYARTNRKTQAVNQFGMAIKANPKNATAHTWLGVLAREAGDLAGAERAYRQALTADPDSADAQLNLAILYDQHLKRPQQALAAYKRYRELAKDDLRVAVWVAELEARLKPVATANQ